jgi:hypothetical protein
MSQELLKLQEGQSSSLNAIQHNQPDTRKHKHKARMSSAASDQSVQIKSHSLVEPFWLDDAHVTGTGDPSTQHTIHGIFSDYQGRSVLGACMYLSTLVLWYVSSQATVWLRQ